MKKLSIIIFIIFSFSVFILSAAIVEKQLTAIKYGSSSGGVPEPNSSIRILNPSSIQLNLTGDGLEIPIYARENSYKSFSWSFSGNRYNNSTLSFTAHPMKNEPLGTNPTAYLPYTIIFQCEETKIGNVQIPYNGSAYVATTEFVAGGTTYEFQYADSIKINNVSASSYANSNETISFLTTDTTTKETTFTYNMNEGSTVSGGLGTYDEDVCNQWNRNGYAMVSVDVADEDIDDFTSGRYSAQIVVEIEGT